MLELTFLYMNESISCGVLIATYNWHEALEVCLLSVLNQSILPLEIVIADDGSSNQTKEIIEKIQSKTNIPIIHVWQKNEGFQAGKIRNKAIAKFTSDYIVQIDGDIIMHPNLIEDHLYISEKGYFIAGSRTLLNQRLTAKVIQSKRMRFGLYTKGSMNILNGIRMRSIQSFLSTRYKVSGKDKYDGKGCNMSFWKEDLIAVNGYDEAYYGWGKEDSDLVVRLINKGVKKKYLKMGGIAYHLFHKIVDRNRLQENILKMNETIENRATWAKVGLDQYLKSSIS